MKQEVFPTRVEWWKEENQVWNLVPEKEVGWVMQRPPGKVQGLVWEHSLWDVKQPCVDVEMLRGTWLYSFGVQERALNLRFTCGSHWQWYFKPTRIGWDHQRNQSFKDYIPGSQTARCHENEDELEMRSIWTLMRRGDSKGGYLKATRRQSSLEEDMVKRGNCCTQVQGDEPRVDHWCKHPSPTSNKKLIHRINWKFPHHRKTLLHTNGSGSGIWL